MNKINLKKAEKTIIQFPDLSTAGYSIIVSGKYEPIIKVKRLAMENKEGSSLVGGVKQIKFEITGIEPGKALLDFDQKRNWEPSAASTNTWKYEITVE